MATIAVLFAAAAPAGATTFCVPTFHPGCPDNGANVDEPGLETAMRTDDSDGVADTILIDATTITDPAVIEPEGTDALTVRGAGPAQTVVTSSTNVNSFVVNLATDSRQVTLADLTIAIPATMPDGQGAAIQITGDHLENVDIVSRNPDPVNQSGSSAISGWINGGSFSDGEIRPEAGGLVSSGVTGGFGSSGQFVVENAVIRGASTAIAGGGATMSVMARRSRIVNPRQVGVTVSAGSVTVENSVIETAGLIPPLVAIANSANAATLSGDHLTVVNTGNPNLAPVSAMVIGAAAGNATATVANSILRGFDFGYLRSVAGGATGSANLTIRHSNVPTGGNSTGAGTLDIATGNITADPQFASATDFQLIPGSPSIDAADPVSALATDFIGAARPKDGDGDGVARADQGAFELQPPVVPDPDPPDPPDPPPAQDKTPPETTISSGPGKKLARGKAKFEFAASEAGSTFECKLDRKAFKSCGSPATFKRLKPGKHTFRVRATDTSGNVDLSPATKKFRVRRP